MINRIIAIIIFSQILSGPVPGHIVHLRDLVSHIKPEHNEYTSKNQGIKWGEQEYIASVVCSGLFKEVLIRFFGMNERDIKKLFKEKWPETDDVAKAVENNKELFQIINHKEMETGDVLLIDYKSGGKMPTEHIMFINEKPVKIKTKENGETEWLVEVIDSTRTPHGRKDSRAKEPGATGVGIGAIVLITQDNLVTGYKWSPDKRSKKNDASNHKIILFRIAMR